MNQSQDKKIMNLLKVNKVSHTIAHTSLGDLKYELSAGQDDYVIVLDSVPVSKDIAKEIIKLITE
jgi:hypothetical protein